MGNSSLVNHDHSWVINVSSDKLATTTDSNQTVWMADNGISINTDDYSETLVVGGDIIADMIYGDGSQLTNVSAVDKYWLMYEKLMTNENYSLAIGTGNKRRNTINLRNGLKLSSDGSSEPGTIAYENGDLVGYGETATKSLLVQDTDTIYNVSSELLKENNILYISTENVETNDYLTFTGNFWEPKIEIYVAGFIFICILFKTCIAMEKQRVLWHVNLGAPNNESNVFSDSSKSNGVSLEVAGLKDVNQLFSIGFNISDIQNTTNFNPLYDSFVFQFDAQNGGVTIRNSSGFLMEIDRYISTNFFWRGWVYGH